MKIFFLIIFILLSHIVSAKTITVYSENDKRLIAYNDSVNSYLFGLYQIEICRKIKNRNDAKEGSIAMDKIDERGKHVNPNLKPIAHRWDLVFIFCEKLLMVKGTLKLDVNKWVVDIYKKPIIEVILYKPIKPTIKSISYKRPKIKRINRIVVRSIQRKSITADLMMPKQEFEYIVTSSGVRMRKEDFEKTYGTAVYKYYFTKK